MAPPEDLTKRCKELFPKLMEIEKKNPEIFLDEQRRDIQNQAKQLVNDIDKIIKCLETYHKKGNIARITGDAVDTVGTGEGHRSLT